MPSWPVNLLMVIVPVSWLSKPDVSHVHVC